ncbi:response regulator transcription factor [Roseicyclus sp. F158]|uniref:Response regulator transcription factor n=1 Tax=Tropicimonas omnivorans TaxID=3075590 RepID=A0ABU3DEG1_9RHOB|nr:response regulator transcription factor [Roseicyclus sp. F158]MDT0682104.1 response regulator transcription factor [Roseicyclus sp. F158]
MRILATETTWGAASTITDLRAAGFAMSTVQTGQELVDWADLGQIDAVIVDVDLPDLAWREAVKLIRSYRPRLPILVLMPPGSDSGARAAAFGLGADDVLLECADARESAARIGAVVRRRAGLAHPVLVSEGLAYDLVTCTATVRGQPLHLTPTESRLVEMLALRHGRTVEKEEMLAHLYDVEEGPEVKTIDVHVCKIRKKIADLGGGSGAISTAWGRGYGFGLNARDQARQLTEAALHFVERRRRKVTIREDRRQLA